MNFIVFFIFVSGVLMPHVSSLGFGSSSRSQSQQDEAQAQEAVQVVRIVEAAELANSVARGQTPLIHPLAYAQPQQFTHPNYAAPYHPQYYPRAHFNPHYPGHQFYTLPPTYYFSHPQPRHYVYRIYNSK